ncbi:hypothetical protein BBFGKLBO_01233 [Synechococcus sp. CBW1107]|uniref:hypothetical protein n=2 Tax=Synechococcus sp. CBW1107 TaxID=2789857 RepID=UPI002AD3E270|nr:hypothetical protein [Synechococcus sp. CBW1107]CAK6692432.1 hypothetical protein BBFGKLBO_01233 [Synechococcus sp. CBW1107]
MTQPSLELEVLIIGFGFSSVPLIRELERTGTDFRVVSAGELSVWDRLEERGRLDFDLVSSYLTSFYSFDLVQDFETDFYPTAQQFFAMHKRWREQHRRHLIRDEVLRIDNFETHSLVHTASGQLLRARNVVVATGYQRKVLSHLLDTDYSVTGQTILFDMIGDSVNLMISKLIAGGNRIIIRCGGFNPRDKVVPIGDRAFTLDQLEYHNLRYVSHELYSSFYEASFTPDNPALLGSQFPAIVRDNRKAGAAASPHSGSVAIKYWPVDAYSASFGHRLEEAIEEGYLLNDIALWIHTGRVVVVPRETPVDLEARVVHHDGLEIPFDHRFSGDAEQPRLPPILIDGTTPYTYRYRDNFMGVLPKDLQRIHCLGLTRPYTGGLANIAEMQSLLVHKLIVNEAFRQRITGNLEERIAAYNRHYYGEAPPTGHDHLVYYGFYTDDVARLVGIDHRPEDCRTLADLLFYYAFPNNALKYRLKGEYAVEGVAQLIDRIHTNFDHFVLPYAFVIRAGLREPEQRRAWINSPWRVFFNDMRHKDRYLPFLDTYLAAYRRVHGLEEPAPAGADPKDLAWQTLVERTSRIRDTVAARIETPEAFTYGEELNQEIGDLLGRMRREATGEAGPLDGLDPARRELLEAMFAPPEHDLAFLSP